MGIIKNLQVFLQLHFSLEDVDTHATAIEFFVAYANDVPALRQYLLSPSGVPCLEKNIHNITAVLGSHARAMHYCCRALTCISRFPWCMFALNLSETCSSLVTQLL